MNLIAEPMGDRPPGRLDVSFVVPARNEETYIGATIRSIHAAVRSKYEYEIIVVDNESTDDTRSIAAAEGAAVLLQVGGTIGALRNHGAQHARGELIVFLDADVTLTALWPSAFAEAVTTLRRQPAALSGSSCSVPAGGSRIERYWFAPGATGPSSHLGSAHLIVNRRFFLGMGGFDETLETGEDYDLSSRVRRDGGELRRLSAETVEHHGFPKTVRRFFRREVWHGTGDYGSFSTALRSKVVIIAFVFGVLHLGAAAAVAVSAVGVALTFLGGVLLICFGSAVRRFRGVRLRTLLVNTGLYYVYYLARLTSFVGALRNRKTGTVRQQATSTAEGHWR